MRRLSAYRVFLTHQSEYHIRGHVCFGVRSRRTGDWFAQHWALSRPLATAYADDHGRLRGLRLPAIGELEVLAPLVACGPALPDRARKVRDAS